MIARLLISNSKDYIKKEIETIINLPRNHPDILYFESGSKLGIVDARKIKDHFSLKPYSAKGRTVVLEDATTLTVDAQNALLKTLEELPEEGMIVLGATSDAKLLPTILSRCQVIHLSNPTSQATPTSEVGYEDVEKLLTASIEERFEYIEKLKQREEFLYSMTKYFHKQLPLYNDFSKELLQAEEWAKANVNIRAILEYLMLIMPKRGS